MVLSQLICGKEYEESTESSVSHQEAPGLLRLDPVHLSEPTFPCDMKGLQ